jgi:hypothetical protein
VRKFRILFGGRGGGGYLGRINVEVAESDDLKIWV